MFPSGESVRIPTEVLFLLVEEKHDLWGAKQCHF